jgi:hypothetical protein
MTRVVVVGVITGLIGVLLHQSPGTVAGMALAACVLMALISPIIR